MRLPSVIAAFARTEGTTVRRSSEGSYGSDGAWVEPSATTVTIPAGKLSFQPLQGADLKELPEGHHVDDVRLVLSEVELKGQSADGLVPADVLVIDGFEWRVVQVQRWDFDGDTHWRCMASRRSAS